MKYRQLARELLAEFEIGSLAQHRRGKPKKKKQKSTGKQTRVKPKKRTPQKRVSSLKTKDKLQPCRAEHNTSEFGILPSKLTLHMHSTIVTGNEGQTAKMASTRFSSVLLTFEPVPHRFVKKVSFGMVITHDGRYAPVLIACKEKARAELMVFTARGVPGSCESLHVLPAKLVFFSALRVFDAKHSRSPDRLEERCSNDVSAPDSKSTLARIYTFCKFKELNNRVKSYLHDCQERRAKSVQQQVKSREEKRAGRARPPALGPILNDEKVRWKIRTLGPILNDENDEKVRY